ncbi:hypothetical protein XELAEV_18018504mg [Xenopus laevis]|uniref:Uncharacterized protein n=1 Tax=Xenopus laevis TaxID=8355 RepID=A0A974DF38_XENLA|nr:hypothetical protein XELAEV_18018504mg [Xenopus laevis]
MAVSNKGTGENLVSVRIYQQQIEDDGRWAPRWHVLRTWQGDGQVSAVHFIVTIDLFRATSDKGNLRLEPALGSSRGWRKETLL